MGLLFLVTVLADDLNNVSQFITMSFCLSDIYNTFTKIDSFNNRFLIIVLLLNCYCILI